MQIKHLFPDCFKHGRRLCHECVHVDMCDGIAANDCDIISLTEYESILNDQLVKLDDHFNEIDGELKIKKASFVNLLRNEPRISRDEDILILKQKIQNFRPKFRPKNVHKIPALETAKAIDTTSIAENKKIIICDSFSEDNLAVNVTNCKRSIHNVYNPRMYHYPGYCFLGYPNIEKNQILRWTLRIPKHEHFIGTVIILENKLLRKLNS